MRTVLALVLTLTLTSCNQGKKAAGICTGELAVGVYVELFDAATQQPIDGAKLTLSAGPHHSEIMQEHPSPVGSVYSGAIDQAGTFELDVEAAGYEPESRSGIVVTWKGCALDTQRLRIGLTPRPGVQRQDIEVIELGPQDSTLRHGQLWTRRD